jgi:hypothetical protein
MQTVSRLIVPAGLRTALAATAAATPEVPLNLPDPVTDWLAKLCLLYGVPFEYLVADARMLPNESIRFFYLDPNWLRRAIDGALSLGATSTRENVFNAAFYEQIYAAVQARIPQVRQSVRGVSQPDVITVGATTSGFLFRSAVVAGYPGLEVVPTLARVPVPILRMDRLSSDIMLVLFNGVPDHVDIRQPAEGLHFGITRQSARLDEFSLYLRWLGHTSQSVDVAGTQIDRGSPPQQPPKDAWKLDKLPMRTGRNQPAGVIDITGTRSAIIAAMGAKYLGANQSFTSAELAVEMVLSAGVQPFDVTISTPLAR